MRQAFRASEPEVVKRDGEQVDVEGAIGKPNDYTSSFRRSICSERYLSRMFSGSSEWCAYTFPSPPIYRSVSHVQLACYLQPDLGNIRRDHTTLLARKLGEVLEKYEAILDTVSMSCAHRTQPSVAFPPSIPCFAVATHTDGCARTSYEIDPHIRHFTVERDGTQSLCDWSRIFLVRSSRTYGVLCVRECSS